MQYPKKYAFINLVAKWLISFNLQVSLAIEEKCELLGFLSPHKVNLKDGKIVSVTFKRTEQTDDGKWYEDETQLNTLKANFLISAFGSTLDDEESKIKFLYVIPTKKIND